MTTPENTNIPKVGDLHFAIVYSEEFSTTEQVEFKINEVFGSRGFFIGVADTLFNPSISRLFFDGISTKEEAINKFRKEQERIVRRKVTALKKTGSF